VLFFVTLLVSSGLSTAPAAVDRGRQAVLQSSRYGECLFAMNDVDERERANDQIREAIEQEDAFLRLTASGRLRGERPPWTKVVVRPVALRRGRYLQFSYFDAKKDISKNYRPREARQKLEELLSLPFRQFHVQSATGDLYVRFTKKGGVSVARSRLSRGEPELAHDRQKPYLLPADKADPFLHKLGLTNESGRPRRARYAKFRQINEFLRLLLQTFPLDELSGKPVNIVDCGCGNAYLTFAAYHYLANLHGLPTTVIGVDANEEIIRAGRELRDELGWEGLDFQVAKIIEFTPSVAPDLVLSLHACDTATDEAIAQGILWGSRGIVAAPCCQHELHSQLGAPLFRPVLRHGILKQRTADILTDALRASVLRIMGYRTDVVQFVSPEHTTKNLMIRAKKGLKPGDRASVKQYEDLKAFWGVEPCIEKLLGDRFAHHLNK
jgi:SAM-dependent methyltransferase